MSVDSDVKRKLETLFGEENDNEEFVNEHFTNDSKFSMEDFTEEEKKEVELALKNMHEKLPPQQVKKWKWSYEGRLLIKLAFYLMEFVIWVALLHLILPFTINTSVTLLQGFGGAIILSYLRFWWK